MGYVSGFPALPHSSAGFRGKDVLVKNNRFDLDLNEGLGDAVLVLNRYGNQYRYLFAEVVAKRKLYSANSFFKMPSGQNCFETKAS